MVIFFVIITSCLSSYIISGTYRYLINACLIKSRVSESSFSTSILGDRTINILLLAFVVSPCAKGVEVDLLNILLA